MKYFVVLIFLSASVYGDSDDENYFRDLDALRPEAPCNQAGGICVFAQDCAHPTNELGLCPDQQYQGVECCHGLSKRETRCRKQGGECMKSKCRRFFVNASDCAQGEQCCLLLN